MAGECVVATVIGEPLSVASSVRAFKPLMGESMTGVTAVQMANGSGTTQRVSRNPPIAESRTSESMASETAVRTANGIGTT